MKQESKRINTLIIGLGIIFGLTLASCKKVEKGPAGPAGPTGATGETGATGANGPEAKTYNVQFTYGAGETYREFYGVTNYEPNDALLMYLVYQGVGGGTYCTPISATVYGIDYLTVYLENSGVVSFSTFAAGTYSSPWSSDEIVHYKIVHIKSSGLIKHPDVDLNNYEEVKEAYDL
jgi:hypothetical protein